MEKNDLFGGAEADRARPINPFGEDDTPTLAPGEAAERIERAARRIRGLRGQLGSEGLTLSGTRELIDELASALEAAARALRGVGSSG